MKNSTTLRNNEPKIGFNSLIESSPSLQKLKQELKWAIQSSLTGITNFIVHHEQPSLVSEFLESTFKLEQLYNNTFDIDAIELQHGQPGRSNAYSYLDQLIYGTIATEEDPNLGIATPIIDPQTGARKRNMDGFVYRMEVIRGNFKDKILIINNVDFSLDFCSNDKPGVIEPKAIEMFNHFRNPNIQRKCKILLVSNVKIKLPFDIKTVEMPKIDDISASHVFNSFYDVCRKANLEVDFTDSQKEQIIHKLNGLTYTDAGEILGISLLSSINSSNPNKIDPLLSLKNVRKFINQKFLDNGLGLQQLTSRPWEDYICPESSNFTWDVKKMLRDFNEIKNNREKIKIAIENGEDESKYEDIIDRIQSRMPHVIALYGQGGTGKSAFPIHLGGLLGFDVWDFNINSLHSKWVGQGAEQARSSIKSIMNSSHIIVRIDEYDRAMGSTQGSGEGMHEAHKQVESEFMAWLQNAHEENEFIKKNIFVIMTTNHKDNITGPMLRSGRIDLVIDIDNFDINSIIKIFQTTHQRLKNRDIKVLGFDYDELQQAIQELDFNEIAPLCSEKGFTVRDVEILIIEMAAYNYYYKIGDKNSLQWNTENFINVLENSIGSMKDDGLTGELILGDRDVIMGKLNDSKNNQTEFTFNSVNYENNCKNENHGIMEL